MRIFKQKKATILILGLAILFIFVILSSLFIRMEGKKGQFKKTLGETQINILETYHEAEKALFFIDQAAKYSAEKAVYDLVQQGGHSERSDCGSYLGYTVWNNDAEHAGEDCYPNIKQEFTVLFDDNLNEYLRKYPFTIIPLNNYDYLIKNDNDKTIIYGFAARNLNFDIKKREKEEREKERREIIDVLPPTFEEVVTRPGPGIRNSEQYSEQYYGRLDHRRRTKDVNKIILHHTGDSEASQTYKTLRERELSVHYIIDRDGTIYYVVDETQVAYHAKGYNSVSIGIEIVNTGRKDMQYTHEQYDSIEALGRDIADRWDFGWDNAHVIAHYQASTAGKWDPSPNFVWSRIGLGGHTQLAISSIPSYAGYT